MIVRIHHTLKPREWTALRHHLLPDGEPTLADVRAWAHALIDDAVYDLMAEQFGHTPTLPFSPNAPQQPASNAQEATNP